MSDGVEIAWAWQAVGEVAVVVGRTTSHAGLRCNGGLRYDIKTERQDPDVIRQQNRHDTNEL